MRPDILHSRNLGTLDSQWTAFFSGVPCVSHGENGRDTYDLDGTNFRYNLLRRAVRPFIHRYSAVSQDLANWLVKTVMSSHRPLHQIYNGVNPCRNFIPDPGPRRISRFRRVLCDDSYVVGTVGRMVTVKDQLTLVEPSSNYWQPVPNCGRVSAC